MRLRDAQLCGLTLVMRDYSVAKVQLDSYQAPSLAWNILIFRLRLWQGLAR